MGKYHSLVDTSAEAQKIINYGKDLGLGIQQMHEEGYTGKGVAIAYVDQPVRKTHEQFRELNVHYYQIDPDDVGMKAQSVTGSMHGTTVLSILAGNTIGVAPETEVYYVAHPSWNGDYSTESAAIGLQIDSNLTKDQIIKYMLDSATIGDKGVKLINPQGFVALVNKNAKELSANAPKTPYYYVLYNSKKVDDNDLTAIKDYAQTYLDNAILKDVANYGTASQIYDMLKVDYKTQAGVLKGIQIFGSAPSTRPKHSGDIPAFDISFKVSMENNQIDSMGGYNTDFFYSNFNNDSSLLNGSLSVYSIFKDNIKLDLIPQWPVARVP